MAKINDFGGSCPPSLKSGYDKNGQNSQKFWLKPKSGLKLLQIDRFHGRKLILGPKRANFAHFFVCLL